MGPQSETKWLLVVLALAVLPACHVDVTAIPPPRARVTAAPEYVCAGEWVTVSWDAGEQIDSDACRGSGLSGRGVSPSDCIVIDRTSTPAQPTWDGTGDPDTQDSRRVQIDTTTIFTATARHTVVGGTESVTVTVIEETEPPGPTPLPFEFEGICDGATPTWKGVALKDRTSGCLEVVAVCNRYRERIRLTDVDDPSRTTGVDPDACTPMFNGRAPNLRGVIEGFAAPVGTCGAERTTGGPPSFGVLVRLQCNRDMPSCAL
jgi:hypothetical protein